MVGMVIALVSVVVMFQVFAVSEGMRRTTTGAGDAQQNGVASLFLLERDARMAGYGLNFMPMLGCNTRGFFATTAAAINFRLQPVTITDGGATGPDQVTFTYTTSDGFGMPGTLANTSNATPNFLRLEDPRFQFTLGDLIALANVPAGLGTQPIASDCHVVQVTSLPEDRASVTLIGWGAASYVDEGGTTRVAEYSPPYVLPVVYPKWNRTLSTGGRIFNLGKTPSATTYRITNGQLIADNAFRPGEAVAISDGIVQLQAQYGYAGNATCTTTTACTLSPNAPTVGQINTATATDQWGTSMPANANPEHWRRVIAVRMALVARSGQADKKDASGNCKATLTQPIWPTTGETMFVDADLDWRCYRYRVFEIVVPIRNLMWFPDPTGTTVPPG
jgi:type IV pilus assembly protein PilW